MQVQFLIGDEIKYSAQVNISKEELLSDRNYNYTTPHKLNTKSAQTSSNQKFKIPLNVKGSNSTNKRGGFDYSDENSDLDSEDSESDNYSEENESDSFDEMDEDEDLEDKYARGPDSNHFSDDFDSSSKKVLRKNKNDFENLSSTPVSSIGIGSDKKPKRELTVDEILKKNDQIMKRKLHAKKMLEEEKRQTIEKILNEDGRKLRERQKKLNEDAAKKEQIQEENYKLSLTKIKLKHNRDGTVYLRFPQGLLLPKMLTQKTNPGKLVSPQKCQVYGCSNDKKYRDPVTKKNYCSVNCYKALKNSMHIN